MYGAKKGIKTSKKFYKSVLGTGPDALELMFMKVIGSFTRRIAKKAITKRKIPTAKQVAKAGVKSMNIGTPLIILVIVLKVGTTFGDQFFVDCVRYGFIAWWVFRKTYKSLHEQVLT